MFFYKKITKYYRYVWHEHNQFIFDGANLWRFTSTLVHPSSYYIRYIVLSNFAWRKFEDIRVDCKLFNEAVAINFH